MTFLVGGTRGLETSAFFVEKMTKNDCSPPQKITICNHFTMFYAKD